MDIFEKAHSYMDAKLAKAAGYYPYFLPLEDTEGTEVTIGGQRLLMIGSNNYLGLTTDPRVRQAAIDAIARYGTSCTGSRFLNGTLALHQELEARLAAFVGKEAALVFSTGYQTNLGTISSLVGRGDIVIADKDDHASIVDGCLLSFGEMRRFSHNDMAHLDRLLGRHSTPRPASWSSSTASTAWAATSRRCPRSSRSASKHGARLMVDDAHSLGVMARGRGTAAHFGVTDQVDLIMGTFSKSFASLGGFIAGDEDPIHYIQHHARSLIFSASMPASNVAAVLAALDIMEQRARARRPPVGGHRTHARRPGGAGLRHRPQRHADHPDHHRQPRRRRWRPGSAASRPGCTSTPSSRRPSRRISACCARATWPPTPTSRSTAPCRSWARSVEGWA